MAHYQDNSYSSDSGFDEPEAPTVAERFQNWLNSREARRLAELALIERISDARMR